MTREEIATRLGKAVARHIGAPGTIHNFNQLTGGANKNTYSFEADIGKDRLHLILQIPGKPKEDEPNPLEGVMPRVTAEQDARLMIAAHDSGVIAPKVRAILDASDGLDPGYITEFVAGETLATKILREDQFAKARPLMAAQCGKILAGIHNIDLRKVSFLGRQDAAQMVSAYRQLVDLNDFRMPAIEYGLRWAAENAPKSARHTVVHGDFRHGNFIVREDGIHLVLDWEVAHSGDPMEDLGWVCVKTWRFGGRKPVGGFGAREELFAAYEKASGHSVDPKHVQWWEAWGGVKWAIGCLRLGMRGVEEVNVERCAIGRRIEEPLWDYFNLIEGRD
ncbi:MAG TPA: phosphotransferase family protein [Candidatus Binataceae bacterium]|nr:phosphotransferase family protein [Candidatus Binataceae bacterium]